MYECSTDQFEQHCHIACANQNSRYTAFHQVTSMQGEIW